MNASTLLASWLERWPAWARTDWALGLGAAVAALALLLWRAWRRPGARYDTRGDRFASAAPITDEQIALLNYLQQAFPDGAVLFRPRLAQFLSVRKSRRRLGAQQRLAESLVDFLICREDGKPLFAFEVDAFKSHDDPLLQHRAAEKNLMLKSAGIRLIRLKGAQTGWPPPEVLRLRLQAAQRTPTPQAQPSGFGSSEFGGSGFQSTGFGNSRMHDSSVMSLSQLMGVEPANGDPWSGLRKRS